MTERIGVFICECGPNIKNALDIEELVKFASGLEGVVIARAHKFLCSQEAKDLIVKEINEKGLSRILIAACSPREHEADFMKICQEAGLNPYLMHIANIREQCAWVTPERTKATDKAKLIIRAALKRVVIQEPLEKKEIDCIPDALVVGAGITGIEAALLLAQKGRRVYLVERLPSIGGKASRYEVVFPGLECAPCMLEPKLDGVLYKDNIEVLTYGEIEEALGFLGNFMVKVKKKARAVDPGRCLGCGSCFEVCPVEVKDEFNENLSKRKAIYIPYPGALPHLAIIDRENCLHFKGKKCDACKEKCPFDAIDFEQKDEIIEIKVGAVVLATGFDIFVPTKAPQYGYGKFDNVYTGLEFERILSSTGPTGGKILLKNGKSVGSVAIIHCVGSRSKKFNDYCSGVCCMYSLTFACLIKKKLPDARVFNFYSDFSLAGKGYQEFFEEVAKKGIVFIRTASVNVTESSRRRGRLVVKCKEISGKTKKVTVDMVILASAMEPNKEAAKIAKLFDITQGKDGFFAEEHRKLSPVTTLTAGVFIAGCAQGPKDIQSSIAQGQAAAGKILSALLPGEKLELEAMTTKINEDVCSGCKICIGLCPYKAITFDKDKKIAMVNDVLCRGCGVCAAACPSQAAESRHFTLKQIFAEIEELAK